MVIWKILGVFFICVVGFAANKLGWIPAEAGKPLSKLVVNISMPCVIVYAIAEQELNRSNISALVEITVVILVGTALSYVAGLVQCRLMGISWPERGLFLNFALFSNNGFLGLPISYTLLGANGLYLMSVANTVTTVIMFSVGIEFSKGRRKTAPSQGGKATLKKLAEFFNPPIIACVVGIILFFLQAPLPSFVSDVLHSIGATMTPLAMMIIGLQLAGSSPRALIANKRLLVASLIRLIIIPLLVMALVLPFYLKLLPVGINTGVIVISMVNFMTPIAVSLVPMSDEYGNNTKLAAEAVIQSTLFSMATVPIGCMLLSLL